MKRLLIIGFVVLGAAFLTSASPKVASTPPPGNFECECDEWTMFDPQNPNSSWYRYCTNGWWIEITFKPCYYCPDPPSMCG